MIHESEPMVSLSRLAVVPQGPRGEVRMAGAAGSVRTMGTLGIASRTPLRGSQTRPSGVKSEPPSQPEGLHTEGLTCFGVTGALRNGGSCWLTAHPRGVTSCPHSDLSLVLATLGPHGHGSLSGYNLPRAGA